jgi:hypothetical protein
MRVMTKRAHHRSPDQAMWIVGVRRVIQMTIGDQLKARYEAPQELSPELTALLMRMDEPDENAH